LDSQDSPAPTARRERGYVGGPEEDLSPLVNLFKAFSYQVFKADASLSPTRYLGLVH